MTNSATKSIAAATATVGAVTSFVNSGPVSQAGGVLDTISSSLKGIGADIASLFTSLGSGLATAPYKLPMANPLSQYASYDYLISMACLSPNEYNFPDTAYMGGVLPTTYIFRGGSQTPNSRVKTLDGPFEFYCNELVVKGQYGFEKGTGNTNSTNLEFTIVEPYSMGMFMQVIQQAAREKGYKNFNEAAFLLIIEFKGSDQLGMIKTVPNTKKFIPFSFNNMSVKVSGAGTVYNCIGVPCNAASQADSVRLLKADTTIKGKTVQEILQTGPNSLQAALNAKTEQQKDEKLVSVPDEYVILFPTDIASSGANGTNLATSQSTAKEKETTAKVDVAAEINNPLLFSKLNISRSSINKTLVQADGNCNDIGKAGLGYDISRPQQKSFNQDVNTKDSNGNDVRANVSAVPVGLVDYTFQRGSDVINVINQVLLKSDIAKAALDRPPDTNGMRPWWRVDVQTYHIANDANMSKTGSLPKLHVYRVVPYMVHASRLLPPNAPAPGIAQLKLQAAKAYDYIYTGKNSEILRFDIDVSNTFYQVFSADNFTTDGDIRNSNEQGGAESQRPGTDEDKPLAPQTPTGNAPSVGAMATMTKFVANIFSTDNKGGSKGETQASRVARMFHDALINGMDMMNITMDIAGDPYYIANSGAGNYTATQTNLINVTKDGNINYQNGEVDIVINFRTPTDINNITGMYDLKNTKLSQQFSGLYKLTTIISTFKGGKFTQTLIGNRRQGQDSTAPASSSSIISTKAVEIASQPGELRTAQEVQASLDLGDFPG